MIGVVDRQTVVIRLELHLVDDSLTGRASDGTGTPREFAGCMGLVFLPLAQAGLGMQLPQFGGSSTRTCPTRHPPTSGSAIERAMTVPHA